MHDDGLLAVNASVSTYLPINKYKDVLVYLQVTPAEGETVIGSVILDVEGGRRFLNKLDDLLRIGRKWRDEGSAKEGKRVNLSPLKDLTNGTIAVGIEKTAGSSSQGWYVWSDRAIFHSSDPVSLSLFRDKTEKAVKWLERQQ